MSGWPRAVLADATDRPHDDAPLLEQVRRAIATERRAVGRGVDIQIEDARCLDESEGLWRVKIRRPQARTRLMDWTEAQLSRESLSGLAPFSARVIDSPRDSTTLFIEVEGDDVVELGPAVAWPFDYLAAPKRLVESPALHDARTAFAPLLRTCLDDRGVAKAIRDSGPQAWRWSWAKVWGPPGTGKTTTVARVVADLLDDPRERVLVVSTTNRATDEVALRIGTERRGRPDAVHRLGRADVRAFRAQGLQSCLPGSHALMVALAQAEGAVIAATHPVARLRALRQVRRLRRDLPTLKSALADERPACVVTTLHAALTAVVSDEHLPFLQNGRAPFTTVVIDEAGLVPRATAASVALFAARQVVLVGDPKQLSPICVATRSMAPDVKRWLAESAMIGLDATADNVQALTKQYRMHPQIRAAVSGYQYDGRLRDAPPVVDRPWPGAGPLAELHRALWIDLGTLGLSYDRTAAERTAQRSWVRSASISAFRGLLTGHPELAAQEGLFVTPYRGQVEAAQAVIDEVGALTWSASTVHAQQGSEADVVLFDVVRTGGWALPEWRRMVNVALSRAKHLVAVLATEHQLDASPLRGLKRYLQPCALSLAGRLQPHAHPSAQPGLFEPVLAAEPTASQNRAPAPSIPGDPSLLGVQIAWHRAAGRELTANQARLIAQKELSDLGPRIVRGVAGSGKTIVLARWAVAELSTHQDLKATVIYGNAALRKHLEDLLIRAWEMACPGVAFPDSRLALIHAHALLNDIRAEIALAPVGEEDRYDYEVRARRILEAGPPPPRFDLLYIDEAQDLGPAALQLILGLVRPVDGAKPARIFYDNAQNVYGRKTPVWAEFGSEARGRSVVLRESFRSTRQAMSLALNIMDALKPLDDDADMRELMGRALLSRDDAGRWRADFCVVSGQDPLVCVHANRKAELQALAADVTEWIDEHKVSPRHIRVLVPSKQLGADCEEALRQCGIETTFGSSYDLDTTAPVVVITTAHSFKGHEAEVVAVVGLDGFVRGGRPLTQAIYVALTRARTLLRVSASQVGVGHAGAGIVAALQRAR
ncbi:MAG: AAA domain-containing protein [Myxococcota bacterium]